MDGILIIDQSPAVAREIAGAAQSSGLVVLGIARDGLEAVALARQLQPTHITIDLVLPRLPGLQVIQALVRHGLSSIVVVVSAVTAREPIVAARGAGARAYLLKPVVNAKLAEILGVARDAFATPGASVAPSPGGSHARHP
jgi:two-component system, chemotaxis family, protein-glutamate methylesterase/glutaminase